MGTTAEEAQPTLHAVYPETVYEVGTLGWHFAAIHAAWPHLLVLAALRTYADEDPEARVGKILRLLEEPTIYFARDRDWQQWYQALDPAHGEPPPVEETIGDLAERELTVLRAPQLTFQRIKLDSPLEITITAAGSTGVVIYALHLLCAFLRDPERIGGWLPRLVTGWHKARRDAEMVRQGHRVEVIRGQLTDLLIKQNMSTLTRLAQNPELQDLHPVQITLVEPRTRRQTTSEKPGSAALTLNRRERTQPVDPAAVALASSQQSPCLPEHWPYEPRSDVGAGLPSRSGGIWLVGL